MRVFALNTGFDGWQACLVLIKNLLAIALELQQCQEISP